MFALKSTYQVEVASAAERLAALAATPAKRSIHKEEKIGENEKKKWIKYIRTSRINETSEQDSQPLGPRLIYLPSVIPFSSSSTRKTGFHGQT